MDALLSYFGREKQSAAGPPQRSAKRKSLPIVDEGEEPQDDEDLGEEHEGPALTAPQQRQKAAQLEKEMKEMLKELN